MMRKFVMMAALAIGAMTGLTGCDNVPAGYVGVQVERYGNDRGVNNVEVKGPGRYYTGMNVDMFLFPTFSQTYVWNDDDNAKESFTFQSVEGLNINADVGVTYHIPRENAPKVFQKYRKGVDELNSTVLRAIVRDELNLAASAITVEDAYGKGKAALQEAVEKAVRERASKDGIDIENIYFVGEMRLPDSVKKSINAKIAATQIAIQKENELRAAEADAAKNVAEAKGKAEANELLAQSIRANPALLEYKKLDNEAAMIEAWEKTGGHVPTYLGSTQFMMFNGGK